MFKFRSIFSLEHDVIPRIPSDQFPPPESLIKKRCSLDNQQQQQPQQTYQIPIQQQQQQQQQQFSLPIYSHLNNNNNNNNGSPSKMVVLQQQIKLGSSLSSAPIHFSNDGDQDNNNSNNNNNSSISSNSNNNTEQQQQIDYIQSINLRIIGRERNGILLLGRTSKVDGVLKTYIDTFDISKKDFNNMCVLNGNVISATISNDKAFIVYTVKSPEKIIEAQKTIELYTSYIYDKRTQSSSVLENASHYPLYYHFLPGFHEKSSVQLLLFQNDECYTVKVTLKTDESQQQYVPLNKKPSKTNIFRKCFWYQYDSVNYTLYSLQTKQKSTFVSSSSGSVNGNANGANNGSALPPSESILKIWSLANGKVQSYDPIPLQLNVDPFKLSTNIPIPLGAGNSTGMDPVFQNIHIIKLPILGLVLCHQEESQQAHSIRISIYLLHLKQKIRYSIPLNAMGDGISSSTRVLFDHFGSLLIIYIPGYFFQYIDCALDHEPCIGITLFKDLSLRLTDLANNQDSAGILSARVKPLPDKLSTSIIPFSFSSADPRKEKEHHHTTGSAKSGQYLFDYANGILYHYQFTRESIRNLFEPGIMEPGTDVQAIHLAIIHLDDRELGTSLITRASQSNLFTTDLFKEYILCSTYSVLRTNNIDPALLHSLPLSYPDGIDVSQHNRRLKDLEVSLINTTIPTMFMRKEENRRRLKTFEVTKSEITNKDGPTFSGFWRNFFGIDDFADIQIGARAKEGLSNSGGKINTSNHKGQMQVEQHLFENTTYEEDPLKEINLYVISVSEFFNQISQRETKDKLVEWATAFRHIQINVVNTLYKTIKICCCGGANINDVFAIKDMRHSNRLTLFQALEKLYSAIEELYCPFPKDFYTQFTTLGFYCLQRPVFLQFLQKGIFVITKSFVQVIKKEFPNLDKLSQPTRDFINQIILQLRDQESVIEFLQSDPTNTKFIVEHLISLATQNIHPKSYVDPNSVDLMPDYSDSSFLPLSVLHDFLKSLVTNIPSHISTPISSPISTSSNGNSVGGGNNPANNNNNSKFYTPPTSPLRISSSNQSVITAYQPFSCSPVNFNNLSSSMGNLNISSPPNVSPMMSGGANGGVGGNPPQRDPMSTSLGNLNNLTSNPIYNNSQNILNAFHFLDQNTDKILQQMFENVNNAP
ncbi:hypothetical protein CYY_005911 [Polysphondylium violaceum]|uniref:Gamma-secretase-activating protein C-terminal domain-containing protein n=1 Tax=Polysphondylium violaceum TaxID=133409 RepID=A0A8J4UYH4_9MYCE|nr:hypothetical protein CYY_005911 [Polysphondylium violaceum]